MVGPEPTIHTISHEKSSTTMVRMAVAATESVFRMPHLTRIAVSPANSAEAAPHILTLNVGSVYPKRSFLAVRCRVTWG